MSKWSDSDNYFVNPCSEVYSVVDLSSDPLRWERRRDVTYDGPDDKDFKSLLFHNDFAVNHQRKVIVRLRERNDEENDDFLRVEGMVQEMKELKSLLKENSVQNVKELKSLLDNTKAELAKKSTDVDALQRKIVEWNSDELRLTLEAIAAATKKVFVDFADLKAPPASTDGDPKPVLEFLQKLRDLIVGKEFGATFLEDANKILASIVTIFNQRNGLKINDMVTSSTRTPADLIRDLNSLKTFVENHFFIDGTVIVKSYGLMKEQDIPAIFRNIEVGEAELHRMDVGPKSIVNLNGESIFYGYFNIPSFGKFKGILTRSDVLPNEIMEKLRHSPYQLDDKRFWFVKANGESLFDGSSPGVDFLGFLLRMNKIFVNKAGRYLKFQFTAAKFPGSPHIHDGEILYYRPTQKAFPIITKVQYDMNENPAAYSEGRVSLLEKAGYIGYNSIGGEEWITQWLDKECAFLFKDSCFIGRVTDVTATGHIFRRIAPVPAFFDHSKLGDYCYVDALATTYFVFSPGRVEVWRANESETPVVPRINYG